MANCSVPGIPLCYLMQSSHPQGEAHYYAHRLHQALWAYISAWLLLGVWLWTGHCASLLFHFFCALGRITFSSVQFSSIQSLSHVRLFVTSWGAARQASLSNTNSWHPPKQMSIESVTPSNHLILCRPLLMPSIFPSIRVFSNESTLHMRWPKYWSCSFSISPSNEYSGLISFRMGWVDLLAVQGTLKSILQHHSSKASILRLAL